jgi:adenylate kinase
VSESDGASVNLIVLGPPGAGKGTQAERFARERGLPRVSTGDMLREAVQAGTEVGRRAKTIMDRGELVSDDVITGIVRERLARVDAQRGFVLDGFPRTVAQAVALDSLMDGRGSLIVVDIVVPEEEIVRRLSSRMICASCGSNADGSAASAADKRCAKCGGVLVQRSDDDIKVVLERLKVYHRQTEPLVEYYRHRPTFRSVNGAERPEQVAATLAAAVDAASTDIASAGGGMRR